MVFLFKRREKSLEKLAGEAGINLVAFPDKLPGAASDYEAFSVIGSGKSREDAIKRLVTNTVSAGADFLLSNLKYRQKYINGLHTAESTAYKKSEEERKPERQLSAS